MPNCFYKKCEIDTELLSTLLRGISVVAYCVRCSLRLRLRNEKILKIKIRYALN